MKLDTYLLQEPKDEPLASLRQPIYLNVAFKAKSPEQLEALFRHEEEGNVYARLQNPNCEALEKRLAGMVAALGAVVTNSGMAAITGLLLTIAHAGGHILASPSMFSSTLVHLRTIMPKFGVEVDFCDLNNLDVVNTKIKANTCMVFAETLSNPSLQLLNVTGLAELCQRRKIPLVLDATFTPPGMIDLQRWPVAAVLHSSTKYIMGNGSLLGGVLFDWGHFPWQLAKDPLLQEAAGKFGAKALLEHYRVVALHTSGLTQQPFAAAMHDVQLDTFSLRHQRQSQTAAKLANYFSQQGAIERLAYLGLASDPSHQLAQQLCNGYYGSLLTLDLGSKERAFHFLNQLQLVKQMTNLGDVRSLIIHPASTMYHACSEEERQQAGVSAGLLRLSVGLEDADDLLEDFNRAFAALKIKVDC